MRVDKRTVQTIKDGNEDCDRTGRNEIRKIGGNGHDTLLSIGCVSTRPAHHRRGLLAQALLLGASEAESCPTERRILPCFKIVTGHRRCSRSSFMEARGGGEV